MPRGQKTSRNPPSGVTPGRDLEEIDAVGEREGHAPGREQRNGAAGPPAHEAGERGHQAENHEVAERIGEVGGDGRGAALAPGEDRRHEDGDPDRRDDQSGGEAVEPLAGMEPAHTGAHQQNDADVDERVEGEVEAVGDRGVRHLRAAGERQQVVDVAGRPGEGADADHGPGEPLRSHEDDPDEDADTRSDHQELEEPVVQDARRPEAGAHPQADVGGVDQQARHDERPAAEHRGRPAAREIAGERRHGVPIGIRRAAGDAVGRRAGHRAGAHARRRVHLARLARETLTRLRPSPFAQTRDRSTESASATRTR